MQTTLNKIREHRPCPDRWEVILSNLHKISPDDEPLSIKTIFQLNGFEDAIWALRTVDSNEVEIREYSIWCVERISASVSHPKALLMFDMAKKYLQGHCTYDDLEYFGYTMDDAERSFLYTNEPTLAMISTCTSDIRRTIETVVRSSIKAEAGMVALENQSAAYETARNARIAEFQRILGI